MINRDEEFLGAGVSKRSVSYPKAFCFIFSGKISRCTCRYIGR